MAPMRGAACAAALVRCRIGRPTAGWTRTAALGAASSSRFPPRRCGSSSHIPARSRLPPPKEIAVLGGGLTGLATAHYLATLLPTTCRITVYEATGRTGGWIDTAEAEGGVPLEGGARMVAPQRGAARYDDVLLLELIDELGLLDDLRVSEVKAAQYVYYPDHLVNVSTTVASEHDTETLTPPARQDILDRLQGVADGLYRGLLFAYRVLTEPVFRGVVPSLVNYVRPTIDKAAAAQFRMLAASRTPGRLPPDDSVGAFYARRLGGRTELVDNLLSALMHGIYGGDVWRLSVASSPFRGAWLREAVDPLLQAYARQAKRAQLQRELGAAGAARQAGDVNEDGEDQFGAVDSDLPPLTPETEQLAQAYLGGRPCALAMRSDVDLLRDIAERLRQRHQRGADGKSMGAMGAAAAADRLARLALASTTWTQFGFARGFGTLTDALAQSLRARPNVTIRAHEPVQAIRYDGEKQRVVIRTARPAARGAGAGGGAYDRVVSTLASPALYRLAGGDARLPSLRDAHAVTIMVVNLFYAEARLHRPYNGFGYLVPQTVPLAENPEAALGVIFDSDREGLLRRLQPPERGGAMTREQLTEQVGRWHREYEEDEAAADRARATGSAGSKFTVMLGGHYWDGYADKDFPTADQAVAMAEAALRRHLGPRTRLGRDPSIRPTATRAKLCRECIPQHYVGHAERMAGADDDLRRAFGGRLAVAGGSFTAVGPGVLASVRSARDIALRIAGRGYRTGKVRDSRNETAMAHVGDTGLARFGDPATDDVVPVARRSLPLRFGNATRYEQGAWVVGGGRR